MAFVDAQPWSNELKRRVQHYGFRYNYRDRSRGELLGPVPPPLAALGQRLQRQFHTLPLEQVIVNEYVPGQGIGAHVDQPDLFGPVVLSASLGSPCVMHFTRAGQDTYVQPLAPRSVVVLREAARYEWQHAIPARREDEGVLRTRRVSLTFRSMN